MNNAAKKSLKDPDQFWFQSDLSPKSKRNERMAVVQHPDKGFKAGDKVRVNMPTNVAYHGQVITLETPYVSGANHGWYILNNTVLFYDSQLEPAVVDKCWINKQLEGRKRDAERLNREVEVLNGQLAYMAETGQDTFDENEFKAYHTLKVLEKNNLSTLERAKAIAGLFSK